MEKADQILQALHDFRVEVTQKFTDGEKRFDKQDIAIQDIQDQIKGNSDKEIIGIRPQLKELNKILVIPIFITRLPKWARWVIAAVSVDVIIDINHIGVISFLQFLVHLTKP